MLAENAGRVVTKEEMIGAIWGDRVVDDANLAQNIAVVRKALAAEKGSPAYIETFPGRGYRLEGPVVAETDAPSSPPEPVPRLTAHAGVSVPWLRLAIGVAVIAIGVLFLWQRESPADAALRVVPATRLPGKEYQPAITADGSKIAFLSVDDAANPPTVWVQDVAGGTPIPVTRRGGHHSSPAWSPDGSSLAFLRIERTGSEVVIASLNDSAERVLTRFDQPAYGYDYRMLDWSPDGRWIALSRPTDDQTGLALYLIDATTGESRLLGIPRQSAIRDVDPRFSPDGRLLSFIRLNHRSHQEILTAPVAGGEPAELTRIGRRISSHDWVPDGRAVVFASDKGGEFRLLRVELGRGDGGAGAKPLGLYSEFPLQISIARKGEALVYSALQQDRNIWRLDLADLTWKRLIASSAQDASPQYSPDGSRICFRSDRSGEEQLWVANADGSHPQQVTFGSNRPSVGRWSPDGSRIVFNTLQPGSVISIAELNDGKWTVRNTQAQGVHPVFSPDGQWIYSGGPSGINRFRTSGESVENVVSTRSEALAMSKDGRFLYFVREPSDTALSRIDLETKAVSQVLSGLVPGCTSCWALSPDGIYFLGSDEQSFDRQVLFFHDLRRNEANRVVTRYPEPLWPLGSGPFSLSPDGTSLLAVRAEPSSTDAMLVTPFR